MPEFIEVIAMTHNAMNDSLILLLEAQPEIVPSSATVPPASLVHAFSVLADVASELKMPVVCSVVPMGQEQPDVIDELRGKGPVVIRSTISAFDDARVRDLVAQSGRKHIVIGGVSSEIAIFHAAQGALRNGYRVSVLADCCGGLSARTESAAFEQSKGSGVVLTSLSTFLTGLVSDMSAAEGKSVMGAIARLWGW
jgi:nicotinamidase-related amidase